MSQNLQKLQSLLAELFQLDQAELDFGIYRIMNARRDEITRFLDTDLLPQVREVLSAYESESRATLQAELEKVKEQAKALGFDDPAQAPKVKELQARYNAAFDIEAAESEVFSHLYNFFRRYYRDGDFISQRRYKEGVYAIPYEGEEVKLYWANHDQYYIKTSEYLRTYTFKLPSGKRVHFKLVEANTEKDNNRPQNGNERRFILSAEQPLVEEHGELVIRFAYRPDPEQRKQAELNAEAVDRIRSLITTSPSLQVAWSPLLDKRPTEKNPNRTLLEKHLTDYTARNTFDYFIHKDLGGFLRRELDFYIKNEVMHLDDIENESAPRVEQYLAKIKAIRRIAHKIIDFLAQIENFQKKLWLKKKFVVETQYCITLDRIFAIEDEETRDWLIERIIANDAQREEWVRLFAIDELTAEDAEKRRGKNKEQNELFSALSASSAVKYSIPLTVEFLTARPTLVVDTRHFDEAFKLRLLAAIPDIDEETDGLLIHSENFQALNLLLERYKGQVQCIYIDPPYNTGSDEFVYRDDYQHSSWLSMMHDRLAFGREWMREDGAIFVNIDDNEEFHLKLLMDCVFGPDNHCNSIVWAYGTTARGAKAKTSRLPRNYDTVLFYARRAGTLRTNRVYYAAKYTPEQAIQQGFKKDEHGRWFKTAPRGDYTDESIAQLREEDRIYESSSGNIRIKYFLREEGGFVIEDKRIGDVWTDIPDMMHAPKAERLDFDTQKPVFLVCRVIRFSCGQKDIAIDFFAGSGTTGHAVINLNREDGGRRKFILVEMGEHFDTVLVPRLKKVIFTPEWKDGKPKRMPNPEEIERSPRILKILRLESYEDTLNNLELKRTEAQQMVLEEHPAFREDYTLHYMLDVESRGSASLLTIERFEDPFRYTLDIATGTAGETKPTVVDLVETFNYLIGLRVKTIDQINGVRVVTGTNPHGERVLILWRTIKELDNDKLDEWFKKQGYNTRDQEYDVIYVNGDNNLENLRKPDQTWKVRLIEEEFKRLMFAAQDV
ncbi:MAG: site-specific DNA-methyltransferase [Chloroflexus sp.]|uniref:site-specific DNA-methyltransferase n=1 Tax=Chloroflexus sp. TaxID=1904827 RepID=UPI0021DD87DE|nr:site-specific DNA-methyltransferase [Chloroflexus sp.]GIV89389.1 MAG: site-specific DNA-methyltransferase [Chloroflexus sp.]